MLGILPCWLCGRRPRRRDTKAEGGEGLLMLSRRIGSTQSDSARQPRGRREVFPSTVNAAHGSPGNRARVGSTPGARTWQISQRAGRQAGNRSPRRHQREVRIHRASRARGTCDRDLPDTADLAQRQWCVAQHPRFSRFVLLFVVAVAGRCVAGAGSLSL